MYKCEICGTAFDHPVVREYTDQSVDCKAAFRECVCPACFMPYIEEANTCPGCDGFKFQDEILCKSCRDALLERFRSFADELTSEQEQQLDEWLDGASVTDRGVWS